MQFINNSNSTSCGGPQLADPILIIFCHAVVSTEMLNPHGLGRLQHIRSADPPMRTLNCGLKGNLRASNALWKDSSYQFFRV